MGGQGEPAAASENQVERLLAELARQAQQLVAAAARAPLDTAVPSCPGWTTGRVVAHVAKVYRWASWLLAGGSSAEFHYDRPVPHELLDSVLTGAAELAAAVRAAPDTATPVRAEHDPAAPARPIATLWPAPSPQLFWARRQAHETAVHRVDVELAIGYGVTPVEADFAADGIDELLSGMLPAAKLDLPRPASVLVQPLDANLSWTLRFSGSGVETSQHAGPQADLTVLGMSDPLYRWLWNRAGDDEVSLQGDLSVADWWHEHVQVHAR